MSRTNADPRLSLGGPPRADLLPPEVKNAKVGAAIRRRISFALVITILLCGTGYALASIAASDAQAQLDAESSLTVGLLQQQGQYSEVRTVKQQLVDIAAAQQVGTSTEIDWNAYVTSLIAALPAGMGIASLEVQSSTPTEAIAAATVPLQGPRSATLTIVSAVAEFGVVSNWLDALENLPGFSDATPGTIAIDEPSGLYRVTVVLHVNSDAYTNRFLPEDAATPAPTDEATAPTGEEG
jgi:Tfp pilus assembly protein PilN